MQAALSKDFHEEYNLKGRLGKGAFAQVHLAIRNGDGNEVAVKITDLRGSNKEESEELDPRRKRTVDKEVAILRKVAHLELCVRFFEDFSEGPLSYVVMEKCDMTLLQALERSSEITETSLARVIRQMLQGLQCIHQIGVVHRDVKPDNFLCTGEQTTVKLCDFGLADIIKSPGTELKGVYGTAPFMSPEMLGANGYGAGTDIWSLGVVAYVLLLGQFPYQPFESTAKAMKAAILAGIPAPSFKPRPSLAANSNYKLSREAEEFLHAFLDRRKTDRINATDALNLAWVTPRPKGHERRNEQSLRPMLYAAKRAGAFAPQAAGNKDSASSIDRLLQAVQAKLQDRNLARNDSTRPDSRKGTKTHPECGIEVSQTKSESVSSHASTATGGCSSTSFHSSHRSSHYAARRAVH